MEKIWSVDFKLSNTPLVPYPLFDNFLKTSGCILMRASLKTVLSYTSTSTVPKWPKRVGEELSLKRLHVAHFQESNVHCTLPTGWLRVGRLLGWVDKILSEA